MSMNKKAQITMLAAVLVAVSLLAYIIASPYMVAYNLKDAAVNNDITTFKDYLDLNSLRVNMRELIKSQMLKDASADRGNPIIAAGMIFGSMVIDKMLDFYITPESIAKVFRSVNFDTASLSYLSVNSFEIKGSSENGTNVTFILRRRGLSWQLCEMIIPVDKNKVQ